MGSRLGFAADSIVTALAALVIVVAFTAFLIWAANSVGDEENACRAKGGAPTWHYKKFECVMPTPTRSP